MLEKRATDSSDDRGILLFLIAIFLSIQSSYPALEGWR